MLYYKMNLCEFCFANPDSQEAFINHIVYSLRSSHKHNGKQEFFFQDPFMDSNASKEYDEQGYQGWNPYGGYPAWDDGIEKDVFVKWPTELQDKHDQNGTVPGRPDILLGNVSNKQI